MFQNSHVGDEVANDLGRVLCQNTSLKMLNISGNNITDEGWRAIANGLCNKASINSVCTSSNHTLWEVYGFEDEYSDELDSLLELNKNGNKFEVVRAKLLRYHFLDDEVKIDEFLGMKLELVPHAMAWIARDGIGLPLMQELVKSMSSLFERASTMMKSGQ